MIKKMSGFLITNSRLIAVLSVYFLLTTAYSVVLPLGADDADETAHFSYVQWLATHHRLPITLAERQAASYRALDGYPPLYHLVAAAVLSWSNPDDRELDRKLTDTRFLVHEPLYPVTLLWPYRDSVMFWHLLRLFSVFLGAATVVVTYILIWQLFPGRVGMATLGAAILAFWPRFVFVTSTATDDALQTLLMAGYLLLIVKVVISGSSWPYFGAIGALLGLAITTKFSVALVPLTTVLFFVWLARRQGWPWMLLLRRVGVVIFAALLFSGWWFGFVLWNFSSVEIQQHGLVSGVINTLVPDVATNMTGADLVDVIQDGSGPLEKRNSHSFVDWLVYFSRSIWEVRFVVNDRFLVSDHTLGLIWVLFIILLVGVVFQWRRLNGRQRVIVGFFLLHISALLPLMLIRHALNGHAPETAQGRHVLMPAAAAIAVLAAMSWNYWSQPAGRRWLRPLLPGVLLFWSLGQLAAIYYWFPQPVMVSTKSATYDYLPRPDVVVNDDYLDTITLIGYKTELTLSELSVIVVWQTRQPAPRDYLLEVELLDTAGQTVSTWLGHSGRGHYPTRAWLPGERIADEALLPVAGLPAGQYTVRAHLLEAFRRPLRRVAGPLFTAPLTIAHTEAPAGLKQATIEKPGGPVQFDYQVWPFDWFNLSYPRFDYRSTISVYWNTDTTVEVELLLVDPAGREISALAAGGNLVNFVVGPDWVGGLYRLKTVVNQNGEVFSEKVLPGFLRVENTRRNFTVPEVTHPLDANFFHTARLIGYNLPKTRFEPGEVLQLPVYWEALDVTNSALMVYSRLYDVDNQVWVVSDHKTPPQNRGGSVQWTPGEVITDFADIWFDPQIPDGIYTVHFGLYANGGDDARFRLPLIIDGQPSNITHLELGPVKLGNPELEILVQNPSPQYLSDYRLGEIIQLIGYDMSRSDTPGNYQVTLYWQSRNPTQQQLTRFFHIRDNQNNLVAQHDAPPGGVTYPTSLWSRGEVIADRFTVTLPLDANLQTYRLVAGLYDSVTGERVPVTGQPDGEIKLDIISNLDVGPVGGNGQP